MQLQASRWLLSRDKEMGCFEIEVHCIGPLEALERFFCERLFVYMNDIPTHRDGGALRCVDVVLVLTVLNGYLSTSLGFKLLVYCVWMPCSLLRILYTKRKAYEPRLLFQDS
jgi:hypothetical protein